MRRAALAILCATVWIAASEFIRNELLYISSWREHYADMHLSFPENPINGALWGVWSLLVAILIYCLTRRFSFLATTAIIWLGAYVLMWVVIGNLGVLPYTILWGAVPLSILEAAVATWLTMRISPLHNSK